MSRRHVVVPRDTFVTTVQQLIDGGEYPSGVRINKLLGRGGRYLSPVECQWRREACAAVSFTLNGQNLGGRKGRRRPPIRINDRVVDAPEPDAPLRVALLGSDGFDDIPLELADAMLVRGLVKVRGLA